MMDNFRRLGSPAKTTRSSLGSDGGRSASTGGRRARHLSYSTATAVTKDLPRLPSILVDGVGGGGTPTTMTTTTTGTSHRRHSLASSVSTGRSGRRSIDSPMASPFMQGSFVSLVETSGLERGDLEMLKVLKRRQAILRELVTTEISFAQDLAVVVQEYGQETRSCPGLSQEDARQIFGGVEPVRAFSSDFALDLQVTAASVLFSEATSLEALHHEDAQTAVGTVFGQFMGRLSKVFSRYCSTHERAAACLQKVSREPAVQAWLAERHPADRTTAWDLPSLLIKPVQRVLKYPLLLSTLLESTPRTHPDYYAIELALKEMLLTAENINNIKKRRDLVGSIAAQNKRTGDFGGSIAKTFARRTTKFKQAAGMEEEGPPRDAIYDDLASSFRAQEAVLESLRLEVQDWLSAMKSSLDYHAGLASSFSGVEDCRDAPASQLPPAVEWREYAVAVSDLQQGAFVELTHDLEREVFRGIASIEAAYRNPSLVLNRRDQRLESFHRAQVNKGKGIAPDRALLEAADEYLQLNETLIQELPIFIRATRRAMDAVVSNLAGVQAHWYRVWHLRLQPLLNRDSDPADITDHFRDRMAIVLASLSRIDLTNGNLARANRVTDGTDNNNDYSNNKSVGGPSSEEDSASDLSAQVHSLALRPTIRYRALSSAASSATLSLKQLSFGRTPSGSTTPTRQSPRVSQNGVT